MAPDHEHDQLQQGLQQRKANAAVDGSPVDLARQRRRWGHTGGRVLLAVTAVAVVLAGAGLGLALSDAGASPPAAGATAAGCGGSSPRLTVQGTGQASQAPDVLTAQFNFSSTAGSSAAALSEDNAKVNVALQALEKDGVQQRDVQTTGLSLQPQYAYPKGVPTLTGYSATNSVTAILRDMKSAGTAIDDVVTASGNAAQINGLQFSFSDPAKVEDEARTKAVHQAVAHAGAMAAAAGRRLGRVCSLADNTQPPVPVDHSYSGLSNDAAQGAVPLQPGTQQQSDQVTMVYALIRR
jgi:hypothetical protein